MEKTLYLFTPSTKESENPNLLISKYKNSVASHTKDFDLYCLSAAIVHSSTYCTELYSKKLQKKGFNSTKLRDVVKIVSLLRATSEALYIDCIRSYDFMAGEEGFI
jgi:hypothetical protein